MVLIQEKKRLCTHIEHDLSNDTIKLDLVNVNRRNKEIKEENINFVLLSVNGGCPIL